MKLGIKAIPLLLKHLDDSRATSIPPLKPIEWMQFRTEYDYNRHGTKPAGSYEDDKAAEKREDVHTLTVGDLCFVALGQIVNREFNVARYQPSGGIVINSPVVSPVLRELARKEYEGFTAEAHKKRLLEELEKPDLSDRASGAYQRLSFYYPGAADDAILKHLNTPAYDVFKIDEFLKQGLYVEKDPQARKTLIADFLAANNPATKEGLVWELFRELWIPDPKQRQKSKEERNREAIARESLVEYFKYPANIKSSDSPALSYDSSNGRARFIEELVHDSSKMIDEAVAKQLGSVQENDALALACMKRLLNRGYDELIINYCKRRIPVGNDYADELEAILKLVKKD